MAKISRIFGKGLITVLPIMITLYLLAWVAGRAESFFGDPIRSVLPAHIYIPGLGLVIGFTLIFVVGLVLNNFIARRVVSWFERKLMGVPVFKAIYGPLRDILDMFAGQSSSSLNKVVLVKLPGLGVEAIGLVTRENFEDFESDAIQPNHIAVLLPLSYMVGGVTLIVPRENVREINVSPERAMQLSLTAWIKSPPVN